MNGPITNNRAVVRLTPHAPIANARAVVRLTPHAPIANARALQMYVINALNTYRKSARALANGAVRPSGRTTARPSVNGSAAVLAKCLAGKHGTAINPHHWSRPHALKQLATALATLTKAIKRRIQRHQDPARRPITNNRAVVRLAPHAPIANARALYLLVKTAIFTYRKSATPSVNGPNRGELLWIP